MPKKKTNPNKKINIEIPSIKKSNQIFYNLFKHSNLSMAISTVKEGKFIDVNDMFLKKFGYKRKEVIGRTARALDMYADYKERSKLQEKISKKGYVKDYEVLIRTKSGKVINGEFNIEIIIINDEKYLLSTMNDMTDLANTRKQLAEKVRDYLDLYDNSPDMLCSVDAKTARVIKCNKTLCRKTGYKKEEIIDKPLFKLYAPESKKHANKVFKTFVAKGEIRNEELQLMKKNGQLIDVLLNVSSIRDAKGNIIASRSAWRDITLRKKMEESLRVAEMRSRAWLDNSPVCTKMVGLDFNLQYMSKAGVDSLQIKDISRYYGKPYPFHFYPKPFKDLMTNNMKKVIKTGKITTQEAPVVDVKGNEIWFHSTIIPLKDARGKIESLLIVSMDTTDRKKADAVIAFP